MFNKATLKSGEMLCSTTIRIEGTDGEKASTGTGFYYSAAETDGSYIPVIITNRHVVKGMIELDLVFTLADQQGNRLDDFQKFKINNPSDSAIYHPDPEVDLCAFTLVPIVEELWKESKEIYTFFVTKGIIPGFDVLKELDAVEDILMVGYPNGIWDKMNNLPLVRRGITSTHPNVDYNGKRIFLIDAPCFPGSSGSPVYYQDKSCKAPIGNGQMGYKTYILGILYEGPKMTIEGRIPDVADFAVYSDTMLNLGFVIKADRLIELEAAIIRHMEKSGQALVAYK